MRCSKNDTEIYEITIHGDYFQCLFQITGKEYQNGGLLIQRNTIKNTSIIEIKKTISKYMLNKKCIIDIIYPNKTKLSGEGIIEKITNHTFIVKSEILKVTI